MVVYDESGHRIEEYDLDKGYLENKSEAVEHRWVVDSEEQGEWVTTKEYPETGGKDVEWRVTAEEQGRWKTVDAEGEDVADFDGTLSDDWPHDVPVPDVFQYAIYHPYTEEELEEREKQRQEAEYASRQAMQLQTYNIMAARAHVATLEFESETKIAEVSTRSSGRSARGEPRRTPRARASTRQTFRKRFTTKSSSRPTASSSTARHTGSTTPCERGSCAITRTPTAPCTAPRSIGTPTRPTWCPPTGSLSSSVLRSQLLRFLPSAAEGRPSNRLPLLAIIERCGRRRLWMKWTVASESSKRTASR